MDKADARILDLDFAQWYWNFKSDEFTFLSGQDLDLFFPHGTYTSNKPGLSGFLDEEKAASLKSQIEDITRTQNRFHFRMELPTKENRICTLLFHALVTSRDSQNRVLHIQGICRTELTLNDSGNQDISGLNDTQLEDRRRLERLLIRAQRFEGIGKLAGGIAHDLNNLLAPIRMATELLNRKISDDKLSNFIDIIQDSTDRARGIIQQILTFSRDGGDYDEKDILKVSDCLLELEKIVKETFPPRIQSQFIVEEPLPRIQIPSGRFHQAILNLLINARDAIKKNGQIKVRAYHHHLPVGITLGDRSINAGDYVCIDVIDTGSGIPPENRERIFDPFFTTKAKEEGTGLGLASVHGIILDAGGFIDVKSVVGKGSRFQVYLPAYDAEDVVLANQAHSHLPDLKDKRVLVVDDERNILDTLLQILGEWGMQPSGFANPEKALNEIHSMNLSFDFALVDLRMPKLSGDTFIRELQSLGAARHYIIITGDLEFDPSSMSDDLKNCKVISKPFKQEDLLEAFQKCLAIG